MSFAIRSHNSRARVIFICHRVKFLRKQSNSPLTLTLRKSVTAKFDFVTADFENGGDTLSDRHCRSTPPLSTPMGSDPRKIQADNKCRLRRADTANRSEA